MKILQVAHSFPTHNLAGVEIYTYHLSQELSRENEVFVFYRVSDIRKKEYELNFEKFNGLNIITINNTFRFCDSFEKFYKNEVIARQFASVLDKIKPDIVHIQHLIFLSTTIINEIKKRGIPVIFTLHDYWLICPQWHFLKKDLTICDNNDVSGCVSCLDYQLSMKKIPKNIYLKLRSVLPGFIISWLKNMYLNLVKRGSSSHQMSEKVILRRKHIQELSLKVDLFIAPSQFLRSKFIEFGIPEERIQFIPHGINTEYSSGFKREPSERIRFGFIGTILPAKGVDFLIEAFNRIKDKPAELKIYGKMFPYKGFESYPGYLSRLVKNGNIRFMDGFDHKYIGNIFSGIDILVIPSIWNENSPLVIFEAFSTKTPVIASRVGGITEIIKDKENGLWVEPANPDDLYDKINSIIDQPDLIEKLKNGIKKPKTIEENAQEIEVIYRGLLNGKI
jgi:glycosyltransferase involved in cell wall biosynthesis